MASSKEAEIGIVPGSWTVAPLGSFVLRVTYGFTNPMPTTSTGPFMVTAKDIHHGRIDYSTARHTSWDAYRQLTEKSRPKINDVLLTKDGSIGRLAICDRDDLCINQSVAVIRTTDKIDSRFLKFLLEAPHYQRRMEGDSDGTTIKHIYITRVDKMQIAVPPIEEQKAIANALGILEDRIELNRRMQETLESMVRALFRSWFVNFDPVRAKSDGRDPGIPASVSALFPGSFENAQTDEIPEGWSTKTLGDLTSYLNRGISPAYIDDGGVLVLNQKCIRNGQIDQSKARRHDPSRKSIEGRTLLVGDVLVNSTGVGTLGRVAQIITQDEEIIVDSHITVVRADGANATWNFLGVALLEREKEIESLGEGSTGQTELSRSRLSTLAVVVPCHKLMAEFDRLCLPFRLQIARAEQSNRTLTSIRDSLLPKLISGEIRVGDAERTVEGQS